MSVQLEKIMDNKINLIENYIYIANLELNILSITDSCYQMNRYIKDNFSDKEKEDKIISPMTSTVYKHYNLLLFPLSQFHELYFDIRKMFHEVNDRTNENYYIQCWLNVYNKNEFIDWHNHWPPYYQSWHGFYCVSGKGSHTTYKLPPDLKKEVMIPTIPNQIVLSKSAGDYHKSSDWIEDYPRITIAFDIVPTSGLEPLELGNHWIPI